MYKVSVPIINSTAQEMGLEKSLEWINDDELVEVTPKSIRIRKAILDKHDRKKAMRRSQQ